MRLFALLIFNGVIMDGHSIMRCPSILTPPKVGKTNIFLIFYSHSLIVYKYYMVRGEVGRSIFPEVLATGLLPRTRRVRGNRPVASTEGKIDPLLPR